MTQEAALEGEVIEHGGQVVPMPVPQPTGGALALFGDTPGEALARVNELAEAIAGEIEKNGWIAELKFSGRISKHVTIEGWQFAGALIGVFGSAVSTTRIKIEGVSGWEAHAVARTLDGRIVGEADGMCMKNEDRWGAVDEYARRSMAQTRALARALSGPLRFAVQKAGFDGTPYEDAEGAAASRSGPRTANRQDTKGRGGNKSPSPAQIKMAADKLGQWLALHPDYTPEQIMREACTKYEVEMVEPESSQTWLAETFGRFTGGAKGQISEFIDKMIAALA